MRAVSARSSPHVSSRSGRSSEACRIATASSSRPRRICSGRESSAPGNHSVPGISRRPSTTRGGTWKRTSKYAAIDDQKPSRSPIDQRHSSSYVAASTPRASASQRMYARRRVRSAKASSGCQRTVGSRLTPRSYGARSTGSAGWQLRLDLHLDGVLDLQRAHERLELLDPELLLAQFDRSAHGPVVADAERHADRVAAPRHAEVAADVHRAVVDLHVAGLEADLRRAQDVLLHALLDVRLVALVERLRAARALAHLDAAGIDGELHRRVVAQLQGSLPGGRLEREVVTCLSGRALAPGLDRDRPVLGPDLVSSFLNWHVIGTTPRAAIDTYPRGRGGRSRTLRAVSWSQREITLRARPRGVHLVPSEIVEAVPELRELRIGLAHLFLRHTSASLTLNENASPDVRRDFAAWFDRAVPDGAEYFAHRLEGDDDMPAHIKTSLTGGELLLPVSDGRLALGTWQGVYLCEHRDRGGARSLLVTLFGE